MRDFSFDLCDACSIFVATKLTSSIKLQSGVLCLDLKSTLCDLAAVMAIKSNLVKHLLAKLNVILACGLADNPFSRQRLNCRHWKIR